MSRHDPVRDDHNLRQAKVATFNYNTCRRQYANAGMHYRKPITNKNICAGPPQICVVNSFEFEFLLGKNKSKICVFARVIQEDL